MKADLRAYLVADPGLDALIGGRVHWGVLPQGVVMPAIALHRVSVRQDYTMAGPVRPQVWRVQVDCWGRSDMEVTAVSCEVDRLLNGFRGVIGATRINGSFLAGGFDDEDRTSDPREVRFRASMDFEINHSTGH